MIRKKHLWKVPIDIEEQIIRELHQVPRQHYREIPDFIRAKKQNTCGMVAETAPASEFSLKKDWLHPGEDEAWVNW
jgi:hypothetical protein